MHSCALHNLSAAVISSRVALSLRCQHAAELQLGMRMFLQFAISCDALTADEAKALASRSWRALGQAAMAQSAIQNNANPVRRFFDLLEAALASGKAHVAGRDGREPTSAAAFGWRFIEHKGYLESEWRPCGERIGWIVGEDLFLEPEAAYAVAQNMAGLSASISIASKTLHKRLDDDHFLVSKEPDRLTVRKFLEGKRRYVLHLKSSVLGELEKGPADETST